MSEDMINRYSGEIRINPVAILRNNDFNNEGEIDDIDELLQEAIDLNVRIRDRMEALQSYLKANSFSSQVNFNFAPGGYIAMTGFTDDELLEMKARGLIDLFDYATDRDWVKRFGARFGLVWENGRAVSLNG
jgi:hypothetical protein